MDSSMYEIVVLKPTAVFVAFLASQMPENQLPSMALLQTDCTAYVIPKRATEDETLAEIEKNFTFMFRNEICRWLGPDARNDIETSFLDFLCCFKFEMHSHLILLESSLKSARQALNIKPKTRLYNWIKSELSDDRDSVEVLEQVSLAQLAENSTLVVKNFNNLEHIKPFLQTYYKSIFETAMSRMSGDAAHWPEVNSFKAFCQYFEIQIHTQLVHLPY